MRTSPQPQNPHSFAPSLKKKKKKKNPKPRLYRSLLSSPTYSTQQKMIFDRPLESGLNVGIHKDILVGEAEEKPLQKRQKSGTVVTLLSLGTGRIRNNRRPLDNESPSIYANSSAV